MALGKITLVQGLALVMVTMLWAGTMAQSDCTSVLITMTPCLDYVTGTSSTPSVTCCSQLASVVHLQPHCLCMALNGGGSSLGVEVNQTLALALPQLCHVKTPPASNCNAADGPAVISMSPSGSPQGLPPHSNDTPSSNSSTSGGSKTVAATSSDVIFNISLQFILFLLPIALFSSTWTTISQGFCY